jgi:hypothetical protein
MLHRIARCCLSVSPSSRTPFRAGRSSPPSIALKISVMHPAEKPALGVDIDEALAAKFPYRRAYLPINRNLDGTMHSW